MRTSVCIFWKGCSLQIEIYNYCYHYRLATFTVLGICGACICFTFGFTIISVVAFDLLAVLVFMLFVDLGSRRCHCLLFGTFSRSTFWMLNQLSRFKFQCYSCVLSLKLEQFHFSTPPCCSSTKRSQFFLFISHYLMSKKSCARWMTNQVVNFFPCG